MSRSNLSILEQNTIAGFNSEHAERLYLRGSQKDDLKAFFLACYYDKVLEPLLEPLLTRHLSDHYAAQLASAGEWKTAEGVAAEVVEFIGDRLFYMHFPKNDNEPLPLHPSIVKALAADLAEHTALRCLVDDIAGTQA